MIHDQVGVVILFAAIGIDILIILCGIYYQLTHILEEVKRGK